MNWSPPGPTTGFGIGILLTNQIYYSPRWKMMFGYEEDEITTTPEEWLKRVLGRTFFK